MGLHSEATAHGARGEMLEKKMTGLIAVDWPRTLRMRIIGVALFQRNRYGKVGKYRGHMVKYKQI